MIYSVITTLAGLGLISAGVAAIVHPITSNKKEKP